VWPFTLRHRIDDLLDEIKPDVVHIQSHLIMGRYLVPSAKARGIRVIATNHIMPENLIKYSVIIPKWFEATAMKMAWADSGRILKQCDAITTPTRRAAELLEAAAGVSGVLAISCGIDASKFANSTPTSNETPRVLFLGRLDYEKHIHNLLRAVARLPKDLNTQVELVGKGGEQAYLEQLATELGIRDQVTFFGHITEQDLPKAYERATVFAMPSIAELQSIATMEAMASGRPVVAADAMALPHLVHDGDNGYLFPPEDIDAFADRLKRVLTASPEELKRLSENSLYLIQAHDIQRTLRVFEELYTGTFEGDTSDDNLPGYSEPIGQLSELAQSQVQSVRDRANALVERVDDVRDNLLERWGDYRADVRERIRDARAKATRMDRKVRIAMRKAQKRIQRER
jgi:glycosyltransferase involved in cell wall biosynthesis